MLIVWNFGVISDKFCYLSKKFLPKENDINGNNIKSYLNYIYNYKQ
jgi:hypothetical protein